VGATLAQLTVVASAQDVMSANTPQVSLVEVADAKDFVAWINFDGEERRYRVTAEARSFTVPGEDRSIDVTDQDRSFGV
jgi:hypothetical protein